MILNLKRNKSCHWLTLVQEIIYMERKAHMLEFEVLKTVFDYVLNLNAGLHVE